MQGNNRKPQILVIGFPKSGTSSIQSAFIQSGIRSAHWRHNGQSVGKLIYDGWFENSDPFHYFSGVDAITQLDYCYPSKRDGRILNYWPNLDLALLISIRKLYPNCKYILNYRSPGKTADSFSRWRKLQKRVSEIDCPGLPFGRGSSIDELEKWMTSHIEAVRHIFSKDENFLEIDITGSDVPEKLTDFLNVEIKWWGKANENNRQN